MNKIMKNSDRLSQMFLLRVIRRGMTMTIPMMLISSIALAVTEFPIPAFTNFIENLWGGIIYNVLSDISKFAFPYFSVMLVIAISISYVLEKNMSVEVAVPAPIFACLSFLFIMRVSASQSAENLGTQSSFLAIIISLAVTAAYVRLVNSKLGNLWKISAGHDIIYKGAMRSVIPMLVVSLGVALFSYILYHILKIEDVSVWLSTNIDSLISGMNNEFLTAVLCTFIIHVFWCFGIHGSNLMEPFMVSHSAIGTDIIFNRTFFANFVLMGGCGTTVCLLLSILLFSKYGKMKNLAKTAIFPVALNINEIITFGLPIILNPILLIPFMIVPIECVVISYMAIKTGLVPHVMSEVSWTTPILVSGYFATGSIRGSVLQLICVVIGTLTYTPFIRGYEKLDVERIKNQINTMVAELQEYEKGNGNADFLERTDMYGVAANMFMNDVRDAVKNKELYLVYQPQFEADGTCVGAEALTRWKHPIAGMIYPPLIIYMAKKGGFLSNLEENLFDMACSAVKRTQESSDKPFKISINVTAKSLKWQRFEECLSEKVEKYGIEPKKLWIEITEQDIVSKEKNIIDKITRLRSKGHEFLIDDFGMGKTSILYLQTELFDGVKLDGSLTKTLNDVRSREIISSVITLSERLKVRTIAEYVETKEECEILDKLGCDWYQGYYFSKPVSLEEFIDRLNQ